MATFQLWLPRGCLSVQGVGGRPKDSEANLLSPRPQLPRM